jgi:glucose/mannose transport system permease protein
MIKRIKLKYLVSGLIAVFLAAFYLLPYWTALVTATKPPLEIRTTNPLLPGSEMVFSYARTAWGMVNGSFITSLRIAFTSMAVAIIVGSIGGYYLSKVRGRYVFGLLAILSRGIYIPSTVRLVPLVRVAKNLNLFGSPEYIGLAIGGGQLPVVTFIFREFYRKVPDTLVEAAEISGASHWQIYRYVMLPLSRTAAVTAGIIGFTVGWNNLILPLILTSGSSGRPIMAQVDLMSRASAWEIGVWNLQLSGALFAMLPIVIIYIILQEQIVQGWTEGAISG